MPLYRCKLDTCTQFLKSPGYCPDHIHLDTSKLRKAERAKYYDKYIRNTEASKFYHSVQWDRTRRSVLASQPYCDRCGKLASHVHHTVPFKDCMTTAEQLDKRRLQPLCQPCHDEVTSLERARPVDGYEILPRLPESQQR